MSTKFKITTEYCYVSATNKETYLYIGNYNILQTIENRQVLSKNQ
jgi:hypothetical protein